MAFSKVRTIKLYRSNERLLMEIDGSGKEVAVDLDYIINDNDEASEDGKTVILVNKANIGQRWQVAFGNILDETDTTVGSTRTLISDYLSTVTRGFNTGAGGSAPTTYYADDYDDLVNNVATSPEEGDLAHVRNSQGVKWLASIFGGTYRAKGWYVYSGSDWVSDLVNVTEALHKLQTLTGNIQFTDTQYTIGSPLTILADTPIQIPNNKGSILNTSAPSTATDWMDSTGRITPENGDGDEYLLRVNFTVDPTLNNRNIVFRLDIGGTQGVIWSQTQRLARGAGTDTDVSINISYYALGTFFANGGDLTMEIDGDATAYDFSHKLLRVKKV